MTPLLYILNVSFAAGQSTLGKLYTSKGGGVLSFNVNKALAGAVMFLVFGLFTGMTFHTPTVLFGLGYGVSLYVSMYAGLKAMSIGPMALTSIIASFSLLIPFLFGVTVWGEDLSLFGIIGIVLLTASVILLNFKKGESGISPKWLGFSLLTFFSNGICSLIQKYHQIYYPEQFRTEFMLCAMTLVLLISASASVITQKSLKGIRFSALGIAAGSMNCAANYIVLYLAATEKASVLFPMVSVANIIAVWIIGRTVFKEKLKLIHIIGFICGLAAILLLNLKI